MLDGFTNGSLFIGYNSTRAEVQTNTELNKVTLAISALQPADERFVLGKNWQNINILVITNNNGGNLHGISFNTVFINFHFHTTDYSLKICLCFILHICALYNVHEGSGNRGESNQTTIGSIILLHNNTTRANTNRICFICANRSNRLTIFQNGIEIGIRRIFVTSIGIFLSEETNRNFQFDSIAALNNLCLNMNFYIATNTLNFLAVLSISGFLKPDFTE